MFKRCFAVAILCVALHQTGAQEVKPGLAPDDPLPGSFQPLNLNGDFKDRHHCLVCQFRINPVALVFVRQSAKGVDPELLKLLKSFEDTAREHYADTGFSAFVVFLTADAKSSISEGKGLKNTDPNKDADAIKEATVLIKETTAREKLIVALKEKVTDYKKVIWTVYPAESIKDKYRLSEQAEVTVILYARHRVVANFTFAEDQLKDEGIAKVAKGVDDLLEQIKKGPGAAKK